MSNDYKCMSAQAMALDHVSKFVAELLGIPEALIGDFEDFRRDRVYARLQMVKEEQIS